MSIDRANIDYAKFKKLIQRGVTYVTKHHKSFNYRIMEDKMNITPEALMEIRGSEGTVQKESFRGKKHDTYVSIISYTDETKHRLISLLTNYLESDPSEIIKIYRKRWEIELLFKLIKQNFP